MLAGRAGRHGRAARLVGAPGVGRRGLHRAAGQHWILCLPDPLGAAPRCRGGGCLFWYRGLALGGIAGVEQLQLLQPFFGLALAGLLLHEPIAWTMVAVTALVVLCVAGAKQFA